MMRPLADPVYRVIVHSVNTDGKLLAGSLMFAAVPPNICNCATVAPLPDAEAACIVPACDTEWRLFPLVSLSMLPAASQFAACHLAHGGLEYMSFSPMEHESQAVDPGSEY
jgi:hypothetical protein